MMKFYKLFAILCMAVFLVTPLASCSDDKDGEPSLESSLYGTWVNEYVDDDDESDVDVTTIVFNKDNSGVIREVYNTRAALSLEMEFDWTATVTSSGAVRLTIVYKSGDRGMIEPFVGNYAQWSNLCTVAGGTLTINTSDDYVMIFKKK